MRIASLLIILLIVQSCKRDVKHDARADSIKRTGIWKYSVENVLFKDSIVEYLKINDREYVNQFWLVNNEKDTIGGNYFNLYLNDSTKLGEVTRIRFELVAPVISKKSDIYVLLPIDGLKLEEEFSNFFELELDTLHSLKNDEIPHPKLSDLGLNMNHIVEFGIEYSTTGKKRIQGVISEKGLFKGKKAERRLYFDVSMYVVD